MVRYSSPFKNKLSVLGQMVDFRFRISRNVTIVKVIIITVGCHKLLSWSQLSTSWYNLHEFTLNYTCPPWDFLLCQPFLFVKLKNEPIKLTCQRFVSAINQVPSSYHHVEARCAGVIGISQMWLRVTSYFEHLYLVIQPSRSPGKALFEKLQWFLRCLWDSMHVAHEKRGLEFGQHKVRLKAHLRWVP